MLNAKNIPGENEGVVTLCFTPVYLLISEGFILGLLLSFQIGA
jgi:hypothetical protein